MPPLVLQPSTLLGCIHYSESELRLSAGFSVGYELQLWRYDAFSSSIIDYLPRFALRYTEQRAMDSATAMRFLREAARAVYQTDKYGRRGEFGELLLHAMLERHFHTIPAVSKIFYKDSPNDTVKGFDAVHVVAPPEPAALELWLGEAKFYSDCHQAIRAVVKELHAHATRDYLRSEFPAIVNKIDPSWPHAATLRRLLDPETSLDDVFKVIKVPVLLTYDSPVVAEFSEVCDAYAQAVVTELNTYFEAFDSAAKDISLNVILLLIPLEDKARLTSMLHEKLRSAQGI